MCVGWIAGKLSMRSAANVSQQPRRMYINSKFSTKQQAFLNFVLSHYVSVGVEELDQKKLTPLLRLKYHDSIADAVADLGKPEEICEVFAGFQKYLYQSGVAD
jgi:type I restriction enzyme R subunit